MSKFQEGRFISATACLIFLLPLVLSSCTLKERDNLNIPAAAPEIYTWDFGQVRQGVVLEHGFILKNTRDRPLTITSMHTSCGCTVSETQKKLLLPGESSRINVKFHTQGYSGRVKQYVYVHTDCASEPMIKFSIRAEIVK